SELDLEKSITFRHPTQSVEPVTKPRSQKTENSIVAWRLRVEIPERPVILGIWRPLGHAKRCNFAGFVTIISGPCPPTVSSTRKRIPKFECVRPTNSGY